MTRIVVFGLASFVAATAAVISTSAEEKKAELSETNRLLARAQKICPVSGKNLDSMGGPIKAEVDGRTVFLCCQGCFKGKVQKEHWAQVNANLISAQGKCPVMGKPLPEKPASIVVEKRIVFVCCPPCTKKIEADSKRYLAAVDKLLEANLAREEQEKN